MEGVVRREAASEKTAVVATVVVVPRSAVVSTKIPLGGAGLSSEALVAIVGQVRWSKSVDGGSLQSWTVSIGYR